MRAKLYQEDDLDRDLSGICAFFSQIKNGMFLAQKIFLG